MMSTRANTRNEYIHVKRIFTLTHTQSFLVNCTTSDCGSLLTHYRIHGTQRSITLVEAKARLFHLRIINPIYPSSQHTITFPLMYVMVT